MLAAESERPRHPVVFREDDHTYWDGSGKRLPGVTQILAATGIMRINPLVPRARLEFARARGSAVHLAIRFSVEGVLDPKSLDDMIEPYLFGFEDFCSKYAGDFEPMVVEEPLTCPVLGFAGTPDLMGWRRNRSFDVIDIKTGAEVPYGTAAQTAAYRMLGKANGFPLVGRHGLHLRDDGTFRLHTYRDPADDTEFRCALTIFMRRWAREGNVPT